MRHYNLEIIITDLQQTPNNRGENHVIKNNSNKR